MTHILIAGGGIAGLTAALALHTAGFERVTVVETTREIQPVGAGLNIMPNAVRELDALGVLDRLEARALRTRELRYYHRSGGLISREPRGSAPATTGPSSPSTAASSSWPWPMPCGRGSARPRWPAACE